jgi:hypothetical protein
MTLYPMNYDVDRRSGTSGSAAWVLAGLGLEADRDRCVDTASAGAPAARRDMGLYVVVGTSGTCGQFAGLSGAFALAAGPSLSGAQLGLKAYVVASHIGISATASQFGNTLLTASQKTETTGFEESVASFYSSLLSKQEPLGKEFERVLHNNLWNLYVRS